MQKLNVCLDMNCYKCHQKMVFDSTLSVYRCMKCGAMVKVHAIQLGFADIGEEGD